MSVGHKISPLIGQTVFDLAVRHTGRLEGLQDIMALNGFDSTQQTWTPGQVVWVGPVLDQETVTMFVAEGVEPKTGVDP